MSGGAFPEAAQEFCRGSEAWCDGSLRGGGRQGAATLPMEGVEPVAFQASVFLFFISFVVLLEFWCLG